MQTILLLIWLTCSNMKSTNADASVNDDLLQYSTFKAGQVRSKHYNHNVGA